MHKTELSPPGVLRSIRKTVNREADPRVTLLGIKALGKNKEGTGRAMGVLFQQSDRKGQGQDSKAWRAPGAARNWSGGREARQGEEARARSQPPRQGGALGGF